MRLILPFVLGLSGCATISTNQPSSEYAPEGSSTPRSGIVSYNPNGLKEVVTARREDAYKKIVHFCGSRKYTIDKQATVAAKDAANPGGLANVGADKLEEIHFTCKD